MQIIQKPSAKIKIAIYAIGILLAISCKPFTYKQGFALAFDIDVLTGRIKRAVNWVASRNDGDQPAVVIMRKTK
jgi:hypothetical protein